MIDWVRSYTISDMAYEIEDKIFSSLSTGIYISIGMSAAYLDHPHLETFRENL